jgi:ABC-type bacteriocin/lantibiotic exporter with double-glycine peptidase domain
MDTVNLVNKTCNEITNKLFNSLADNSNNISPSDNIVSTNFLIFGYELSLFSIFIIVIVLIVVLKFLYSWFFNSKNEEIVNITKSDNISSTDSDNEDDNSTSNND